MSKREAVKVETLEEWRAVLTVWFAEGFRWQSSSNDFQEDYFLVGKILVLNEAGQIIHSFDNGFRDSARITFDEFMKKHKSSSQTPTDALRPDHYKNAKGTDLFGAMEEQFTPDEFRGFLKGNIWKYTQRYKQKNGVEDLEKAQEYLKTLIEFESGLENDRTN